ncbi:MAG: helicase HerA domain-containing protein, partial [Candidatus Nanoarchaeia archaeon]
MPYDIIVGRNEADKKSLGDKGLTFIGKGYVKMGQYTSLSNRILMDVARSHVVLVAGKRGSGKSYTLGVLAEELSNLPKPINENIASLIFDTMGIYWTMKFKNEKDRELLQDWKLKTKTLPVKIFVPAGHYESYIDKGIPVDNTFALDPTELNASDWILTFGLDIVEPVAVLIERTITFLKEQGAYSINKIIKTIEKDEKNSQEVKNAAIGLFEAAETWGVFAQS